MTTRKIIIKNEYLRLCKTIDNLLDNLKYSFEIISLRVVVIYIYIRYYYLYIKR